MLGQLTVDVRRRASEGFVELAIASVSTDKDLRVMAAVEMFVDEFARDYVENEAATDRSRGGDGRGEWRDATGGGGHLSEWTALKTVDTLVG